jgi:hypothetical protein
MRAALQLFGVLGLIVAPPAAAQNEPAVVWCGRSHNVTGGAGSSVRFEVLADADGALAAADGQWPDEGLYGRFTGTIDFAYRCAAGRVCLQFTGNLGELEAAGFPAGTESPMVVALDAAADWSSARGAYRIDAIPPGYPVDQYGVIELGACEAV